MKEWEFESNYTLKTKFHHLSYSVPTLKLAIKLVC